LRPPPLCEPRQTRTSAHKTLPEAHDVARLANRLLGRELQRVLQLLESLEPRTDDDATLIAAHKVLTSLRLPDMDKARTYLDEAKIHGGDTGDVKALEVNTAVHEGRLRVLAADARSLLGERREASQLLAQAMPAERATPRQRVVLADSAASRALDFKLALDLLGDEQPSLADERRIRAEALGAIGTAVDRDMALRTLEELVNEGGPEATEATFSRLVATCEPRRVAWYQPAEDCLVTSGHSSHTWPKPGQRSPDCALQFSAAATRLFARRRTP
jgi:hypothetical protein